MTPKNDINEKGLSSDDNISMPSTTASDRNMQTSKKEIPKSQEQEEKKEEEKKEVILPAPTISHKNQLGLPSEHKLDLKQEHSAGDNKLDDSPNKPKYEEKEEVKDDLSQGDDMREEILVDDANCTNDDNDEDKSAKSTDDDHTPEKKKEGEQDEKDLEDSTNKDNPF